MGFLSMLSYLVPKGYNARISNVASMMVMSDKFDPVKYLKSLNTEIYGIDLHWLPHVHGAISIADAKEAGCKKFDVYFTLGISGQGEKELEDDIEYATKLMNHEKGSDMKVYSFISPLTPFIDPGSLIYEKPEKYGFHITARTIEEYYNLLDKGKSWVDFLIPVDHQ